ncbi:hypothetical protein QFW82_17230 [Streptomyces malaysiensis subsp. malaysiensis]|uniref:hypothetical protein n=1 Tax=Streptomyces malaysiensis TaxID=92644 RepID=UPI0024C0E6C3|nr:hypothetical protein [Streptomyces sp. NA07423]WHX18673.1 hypothetical protein QFW82_17230 [Streptomyces sp. NA07423]
MTSSRSRSVDCGPGEGPGGQRAARSGRKRRPFQGIAETIARGLGLPAVSLTPDEAATHFPSPAMTTFYGFDGPVSSSRTRELLGWSPAHPTLLDDLEHGDYLAAPAS